MSNQPPRPFHLLGPDRPTRRLSALPDEIEDRLAKLERTVYRQGVTLADTANKTDHLWLQACLPPWARAARWVRSVVARWFHA